MTLTDLTHTIAWIDPEERRNAADIIQSFQQFFNERQIPVTPILVLRVRDYLRHHLLSDRVERNLIHDPAQESQTPSPLSTINCQRSTASPPPAAVDSKLSEQIGKTQDRQRRSLKDLEDTINKLDPSAPPSRTSPKLLAGQPSGSTKPCDPVNNANFIQNLIEEVGIDLNDEEFFSDGPNFYDLPLEEQIRLRPETAPKTPVGRAILAKLAAASNQSEPPAPACNTPLPSASSPANAPSSPAPAQPAAQSPDLSAGVSAKEEMPIEDESPSSHDSHPTPPDPETPSSLSIVNCPLSISPGPSLPPPPSWKSPIPPTPPPKVFIYKPKPTPFNQSPRFKRHAAYQTDR